MGHNHDEDYEDEEYEDEEDQDEEEQGAGGGGGGFLAGLIVGSAVGAAVGLLFAPGPGDWTRRRIGRRLSHLRDRARHEVQDFRDEARRRMARARS